MEDADRLPSLYQKKPECKTFTFSLGVDFENHSHSTQDDIEVPVEVSRDFKILDEKGNIIQKELERATDEALSNFCNKHTSYDCEIYESENHELKEQLVKSCLDHTTRNSEGRLVMPLLWNSKVSQLLGKNFNLFMIILKSNLKKLQKNPTRLKLMDEAIKEERNNIIEIIENLDQFLQEHPEASFLPHMGVFKLNRETTKCRVVFLSNLCEKGPAKVQTISHNQAIHAGPCLNQKLSSVLLHLRFDKHLVFRFVQCI